MCRYEITTLGVPGHSKGIGLQMFVEDDNPDQALNIAGDVNEDNAIGLVEVIAVLSKLSQ